MRSCGLSPVRNITLLGLTARRWLGLKPPNAAGKDAREHVSMSELARVVIKGASTDTRQQSLPNGLVVGTGMHGC